MNTKPLARRRCRIYTCIALAIAGLTISFTAEAQPVNSLVFSDTGTTLANGSETGNLNTATSFTTSDVSVTGEGVFAGLGPQSFNSVSFNLTNPTSLTFGNAVFGTYTSTSIVVADNVPGFLDVDTAGNWTPGTYSGFSGLTGPVPASLSVTFTQSPAGDGLIGGGESFSISPLASSPEPATWSMLGISLAALAGIAYWGRKRDHDPDATDRDSV